jgi:hypothetical protein
MPALTYINSSSQEQPVTPTTQLPTSAIDGYLSATAAVVSINGGATAVTLGSLAGKAVDLFNNTGVDLEYRRGAASLYFPIPNGTSRLIPAIGGNANTLSFRRLDQNSAAVTLVYEVLS